MKLPISTENNKPNFAFIDSQNLNLGVRALGWRLDFGKFRLYLKNKYNVQKAYLFIGQVPGNEMLYLSLQEAGYILIFKPTVEIKDDTVKGNVDAELVLHASAIQYDNYDKAIIVSGDGDFACLVEFLASETNFCGCLYLIVIFLVCCGSITAISAESISCVKT